MRIAFDFQVFSLQSYGGISRYVTRMAEQLPASHVEAHIFAGLHRNFHLDRLPASMVSGTRVEKYYPKTARAIYALNFAFCRFSIKGWAPTVVHETYYTNRSSGPKGYPVVLTVHDMIHELFPDSFPAADKTSESKRSAVARADHIICISESTRNDLVKIFGTPEEKISVIHHGFDFDSPSPNSVNLSQINARPFILYVGSRSGYKNFNMMLNALASSPFLVKDFDVVAFGGGDFSLQEMSDINSFGFLDGQVRQVSGDDSVLANLYQSARALIYPSIYEGFGLPPLEAMANFCPVVSSRTSSMPEIIGDAAEFFDPLSVEDMKIAIEKVVYDDEIRSRLQLLGRERLSRFSWSRCASDTISVYKKFE